MFMIWRTWTCNTKTDMGIELYAWLKRDKLFLSSAWNPWGKMATCIKPWRPVTLRASQTTNHVAPHYLISEVRHMANESIGHLEHQVGCLIIGANAKHKLWTIHTLIDVVSCCSEFLNILHIPAIIWHVWMNADGVLMGVSLSFQGLYNRNLIMACTIREPHVTSTVSCKFSSWRQRSTTGLKLLFSSANNLQKSN